MYGFDGQMSEWLAGQRILSFDRNFFFLSAKLVRDPFLRLSMQWLTDEQSKETQRKIHGILKSDTSANLTAPRSRSIFAAGLWTLVRPEKRISL